MGSDMDKVTAMGWVSGKVQGVGFRYFVQCAADKHGVTGYAKNLADGRVEVLLSGGEQSVWEVKKSVLKGPLLATVQGCQWQQETENQDAAEYNNFTCS